MPGFLVLVALADRFPSSLMAIDASDGEESEVDNALALLLREKRVHLESVTLTIHRAQQFLEREQLALDRERLALESRRQDVRLAELDIEAYKVSLARRRHEFEKERERWRRDVAKRLPAGFNSVDEYLAGLWPHAVGLGLGERQGQKRRADMDPESEFLSGTGKKLRSGHVPTELPPGRRPPRVAPKPPHSVSECPYPPSELLPWARAAEDYYQLAWDRYVLAVGKGAVGRRKGRGFLPAEYLKSRFPDTWTTFKINVTETLGGTGHSSWHIPKDHLSDFFKFAEADTPKWPTEPRPRPSSVSKASKLDSGPTIKGKEKEDQFKSNLPAAIPRVVVRTRLGGDGAASGPGFGSAGGRAAGVNYEPPPSNHSLLATANNAGVSSTQMPSGGIL
ncbi:hypothetical protein HDU93_002892, partial [Gonapodya sp. JEL0774]